MRKSTLVALTLIIAGVSTSQASIVAYDYTAAPVTTTITTIQGGTETGSASVFFSLNGADLASGGLGDLTISLYASATKGSEEAYVQLGSGFKTAVLDELVDLTTIFTQGTNLITVGKNNTDFYDSYLALELNGGNGEKYYGWAKVRADVNHTQGSQIKTATTSFTVTSLAYNDVEDDSIVVGAIPEPAVASLVILFGTGVLFSRRIFTK